MLNPSRDEVMQKAKDAGFIVEPCEDPNLIAVRSYKPDTNERMRLCSSGELYTRGDDGWMYQVGTIDDLNNYLNKRGSHV